MTKISITTLSIMTLSITTLSITTLSITTLSITTLSITTLNSKGLYVTLSISKIQHNIDKPYADCGYAECFGATFS